MNGQMSYGFFRCIAALSRNFVIANTSAHVALIWLLIFSGFVLARGMDVSEHLLKLTTSYIKL